MFLHMSVRPQGGWVSASCPRGVADTLPDRSPVADTHFPWADTTSGQPPPWGDTPWADTSLWKETPS